MFSPVLFEHLIKVRTKLVVGTKPLLPGVLRGGVLPEAVGCRSVPLHTHCHPLVSRGPVATVSAGVLSRQS